MFKILELTNKHVLNKMINVRQSDPSSLTNDIRKIQGRGNAYTININIPTVLMLSKDTSRLGIK